MSTKSPDHPIECVSHESVRLGSSLGRIYRRWRQQVVSSLEDLDVTDATRMPLIILYDHGEPMQQKDIAAVMAVDTSSLVRVLRILSDKGLLTCRPDEADKRAKAIALTDTGRDLAARIIRRSQAIEAEALSIFTEAEATALKDALDRLGNHFESGNPMGSR